MNSTPSKASILERIVADKRVALMSEKIHKPFNALRNEVKENVLSLKDFPFERALRAPKNTHLITEIKPSSPSAGVLQAHLNLDSLLDAYNRSASAISVLTDGPYFGGSFDRLTQVSQQSPHPTLCKDFVIDEYMVYQARLAGAAAVLLIVKILDDTTLQNLHDEIRVLGMTPVVEVQNENELSRALTIGATVLLVNNRDLSSFEIDLQTTTRLAKALKEEVKDRPMPLLISASGIETRQDIEPLLAATNCFLIGSSLMKREPSTLSVALLELAGE
jgi:indole-3-glycerol phosphate synthase/phosphoribosylanthranilate isomerase